MNILCFDISSGGLAAAVFDESLNALNRGEIPWRVAADADGAATLDVEFFSQTLIEVTKAATASFRSSIDAISFSAFMHNCILLDSADRAVTPILTWMDRRGGRGVEMIRKTIGDNFHAITGCRYHPMFPVFKLASFEFPQMHRVISAKALAVAQLTGVWVEDHGTASASGLYDVRQGTWSQDILRILGLNPKALLPLVERDEIVGHVTPQASSQFGITAGTPVAAGSGDGFLANTGSGCDEPARMAVTLGTSSSARQLLSLPVLNDSTGTFCYRAQQGKFLLGCASSNGGNVLDWARSVFGALPDQVTDRDDLPVFIPLLNGERSPEWSESVTGSWQGIKSSHTAADLARAVVDGVVFNLAHYVDILEKTSGFSPAEIILSGNGFLNPLAPLTLASVVNARVLRPRDQGLASLRGAAICGFAALGRQTQPAIERIVSDSDLIRPENDSAATRRRYDRYREDRRLYHITWQNM